MAKRSYVAWFEHTDAGYGVSFPDLPGCVSAGDTLEEAVKNAEEALSLHLEGMVEEGETLPEASSLDALIPVWADQGFGPNDTWGVIRVEAPDAAERVNIYLAASLLERVETYCKEEGINRSAFFVSAARTLLGLVRPAPLTPEERRQRVAAIADRLPS